eukprot:223663-Pyramimonas_sp.AAC.2
MIQTAHDTNRPEILTTTTTTPAEHCFTSAALPPRSEISLSRCTSGGHLSGSDHSVRGRLRAEATPDVTLAGRIYRRCRERALRTRHRPRRPVVPRTHKHGDTAPARPPRHV